jgi:hypothetical protein
MKRLALSTAVALVATMPTVALADGVAASLSASFGGNDGTVTVDTGTIAAPTSVSAAGAAGGFAVASSVATATSSGAASGATSDSEFPPMASVTYDAGAYETSVTFAPSNFEEIAETAAADAIAALCAGIDVSQSGTTVTLDDLVLPDDLFLIGGATIELSALPTTVIEGDITVTCP